jgi:hypothetical protein
VGFHSCEELYIYPVLHGEIGLANDALDGLYDVLDGNVEIMRKKRREIVIS